MLSKSTVNHEPYFCVWHPAEDTWRHEFSDQGPISGGEGVRIPGWTRSRVADTAGSDVLSKSKEVSNHVRTRFSSNTPVSARLTPEAVEPRFQVADYAVLMKPRVMSLVVLSLIHI